MLDNSASIDYVAKHNGEGCTLNSNVLKRDCVYAANQIGFIGNFESVTWADSPPGCFVGFANNSWGTIYYNAISRGTLGRSELKSICTKSQGKTNFIIFSGMHLLGIRVTNVKI